MPQAKHRGPRHVDPVQPQWCCCSCSRRSLAAAGVDIKTCAAAPYSNAESEEGVTLSTTLWVVIAICIIVVIAGVLGRVTFVLRRRRRHRQALAAANADAAKAAARKAEREQTIEGKKERGEKDNMNHNEISFSTSKSEDSSQESGTGSGTSTSEDVTFSETTYTNSDSYSNDSGMQSVEVT